MWKGKLTVKLVKDGVDIEIAYIQDLIDLDLAEETDRIQFME